jgi:hypothetical protein
MNEPRKFGALILTHGRPDKVLTIKTLRRRGYTGPIWLVVDDEDESRERYLELYGNMVVSFSKDEAAKKFDIGDNQSGRNVVVFARNMAHSIAEGLGLTHFVELDDDYEHFVYRHNSELNRALSGAGDRIQIGDLDRIFAAMCEFVDVSGFSSFSMAQGGDYIGWSGEGHTHSHPAFMRKTMNSFVCRTDRPFRFIGRINEDVNTYVRNASTGELHGSTGQISLGQVETQKSGGGLTEAYLELGTYTKSFYTVLFMPSAAKVSVMGIHYPRIYHSINWRHAVPKIIRESVRKVSVDG